MKIISWNVNGIRAWYKKGQLDWLLDQEVDLFCVQETKAEREQLPGELELPAGHYSHFNSSKERKGHSGTAIYSRFKPDNVTYGLENKKFNKQGRQINFFWTGAGAGTGKKGQKYCLINCYFPNGGGPAERLKFKLEYYAEFLRFVKSLRDDGYKVIFCGDVNVAHNEIDLARPENNKKSVGFLPEERAFIDKYIEADFVDVFRTLNPEKVQYSWWDMKTRARDRNVGWRIDYFFVDKTLLKKVKKIEIMDQVHGSDHCPILLDIEI
jgi:exodeoxyribonuclease-3